MLDQNKVNLAIEVARRNWGNWKKVYEHNGTKNTNPVLEDQFVFNKFCFEYKVVRTIRSGTRENLRKKLQGLSNLEQILKDDTGRELDALEESCRKAYSSKGANGKLISFFSKVAAFLRPEVFIAYDQYAKKGLRKIFNKNYKFQNYTDYLALVNEFWVREKEELETIVRSEKGHNFETNPKFLMRVLDVYLMDVGGRKWEK